MHHILSLKLISTSFEVVSVCLDGSRRISFQENSIETKTSFLDSYATRHTIEEYISTMKNMNLCQFISQFKVVNDVIVVRPKSVVVKTYPSLYPNPKKQNYYLFCKYQLIKYKPWRNYLHDAWGDVNATNQDFVSQWNTFLGTECGHILVPNWSQELAHAEVYFSNLSDDDSLIEEEQEEVSREDWMCLADLHPCDSGNINSAMSAYWESSRQF